MKQVKNWWFGTKNFVSDDINRLSNVDDDNVDYLVFRQGVSKSSDPFLHGIVRFKKKVKMFQVCAIVGSRFMITVARHVASHIEAYKLHKDSVEVKRKRKSSPVARKLPTVSLPLPVPLRGKQVG